MAEIKKTHRAIAYRALPGVVKLLLAILILPIPVFAFVDVMDVLDFVSSVKSRLMGYRADTVEFMHQGQSCKLQFVQHVNPPGPERVLLLHGFGDTRMGVERFIRTYREHHPESYKSFLVIEWPRHGDSDCSQADTVQEAAETVALALESLDKAQDSKLQIRQIVGTSLGAAVSVHLAAKYPEAGQVWIAPPFLEESALEELLLLVSTIDSEDKARVFMDRVLTKDTQLPGFVLRAVKERVQRARPFVSQIDRESLARALDEIKASQVQIVAGAVDELTPPSKLAPDFLKTFKSSLVVLEGCGHDLGRACAEELIKNVKVDLPD